MAKQVLIINANPNQNSFSSALAQHYFTGAKDAGAEVKLVNLTDLDFDPVYHPGTDQVMEADLLEMQKAILKAEHLVFVYPNWWGTYPALFKGFIDRVFIHDFAFRYKKNSPLPEPLLKGKSARAIVTMDTPFWYYTLVYRKSGHHSMKNSILHFCGIKPVRFTVFTPIRHSDEKTRIGWLEKVEQLGRKLK